jgi:glycosyltransferase involved in cell wall biosynthesis
MQSSDAARVYEKYGYKVIAIPPGVDTERFSPGEKDEDLLERYGCNSLFHKVLLFVGGLDSAHYFKGLSFLTETLGDLSEDTPVRLIVVGDGDLREEYEREVRSMGMEEVVKFAGKVSDDELPLFYRSADAVILPSLDSSEAFGIVLIEAMSSGKPVLASNLPGVRTVVDQGGAGYVFPVGNKKECLEMIHKLLLDEDTYDTLAHHARNRAVDHYSKEIVLKKLIEVYENLRHK